MALSVDYNIEVLIKTSRALGLFDGETRLISIAVIADDGRRRKFFTLLKGNSDTKKAK